ncbi:uncharacterized protein LOC112554701 isoform X2 [Pomacea canaliculata]|uniref:uncharacterized protein LOC112554701 isoform X2 n=1 Tax=Pomacea canaliculata TaxID=400727 RepID=UPI000D73568D|nr:uncharacterized protein LOC112554701 isoform X2 [Pomacea canaliculata]
MAQLLKQLDEKNHDLQEAEEIFQELQNQFDEERRQNQKMMQKLASLEATCTETQDRTNNLEAEEMKWKKEKKEFEDVIFKLRSEKAQTEEYLRCLEALDDINSVSLELAQLRETNKQIRNQLNLKETQWKADKKRDRLIIAGLETNLQKRQDLV